MIAMERQMDLGDSTYWNHPSFLKESTHEADGGIGRSQGALAGFKALRAAGYDPELLAPGVPVAHLTEEEAESWQAVVGGRRVIAWWLVMGYTPEDAEFWYKDGPGVTQLRRQPYGVAIFQNSGVRDIRLIAMFHNLIDENTISDIAFGASCLRAFADTFIEQGMIRSVSEVNVDNFGDLVEDCGLPAVATLIKNKEFGWIGKALIRMTPRTVMKWYPHSDKIPTDAAYAYESLGLSVGTALELRDKTRLALTGTLTRANRVWPGIMEIDSLTDTEVPLSVRILRATIAASACDMLREATISGVRWIFPDVAEIRDSLIAWGTSLDAADLIKTELVGSGTSFHAKPSRHLLLAVAHKRVSREIIEDLKIRTVSQVEEYADALEASGGDVDAAKMLYRIMI